MRATLLSIAVVILSTACTGRLIPDPHLVSDLHRAQAKAHRDKGVELLVQQGKVDAAQREFARAVELDPDDSTCRQWAAWTATLLVDEEQAFGHLLQAIRSGDRAAELYIWLAYRVYSSRGQAELLAVTLKTVIERQSVPPTVRARALHFYGQALRDLGRHTESAGAFARLGYLRDWMLVGPFDNDQNAGFDTEYPPEKGFQNYQETYPGKLRPVGWRRVEHFDYDGRVNLAALLDPSRWTCAYLVTYIKSESAQEIALRLGAYRGVKLWLNGRRLLSDDQAHLGALDQYVAGGRLEPGWNKLKCKVCQRTGRWHLRLRLTDLAGNPLQLTHSAEIHPTPDRSADTSPQPEPDSFPAWLKEQPDDPHGFKHLLQAVWSRRTGFFKRSVAEATALAEAHPRCPLYRMLLARAHFAAGHEGSALKAVREAERLVPGLPDALLERARYEQRHQRHERALKILAPLIKAEPVMPAVRAQRISLLADRGWVFDALQAANSFLAVQPDRPWTWRMIGSLHFSLDQPDDGIRAYEKSLQLEASHEGTYNRLVDKALQRGRYQQALDIIRRKGRVFPCLITSALREARILLAMQEYNQALSVCDRVAGIAPDYWYQQKLRGDIHYRRGERQKALLSYHAALQLQPDNPQLREYLDFLEQRRDEVFDEFGLSEPVVEKVLTQVPDAAAFPEAEAVFLLDDHVTHVFQDGSASHLVRQVYLLRTEKALQRFSRFRVPSSSSFKLDTAETIKPDGTRQEATSIRRGVIHFPALEPGSLLHVAYRYESSSSSWMEDHFDMSFNFQGRDPCLRARWVLALPADKQLKVLKTGELIKERTDTFSGQPVRIWTAEHAPMLHRESMRPPIRLLRAAVYVSTVPSWDVLARWQNSLISDQFEVNDEIRKKTEEITKNEQTPLGKLRAIYQFVAKEVRYLHHDVGIFGKKPNKAINVFENRFGDCKDKATIMIAMLKHVGIQAAYAAVRTVEKGPVFWEVPHAQTNHIITYIPAQKGIDKPLFVDGTSQYGDLEYLLDRNQGIRALVLDGETHKIIETPSLPPETSTLENTSTASIRDDDTLVLRARERWTGWFAYTHRSGLNVEGKRLEELAKELSYRYPGAVLKTARFSGLDTLDKEAGCDFTLEVPGQVRREGKTLRVNLLWPSNLARGMARKPERRYDIFMVYRTNFKISGTLQLPEGPKIKTLPVKLSVDNDLFRFEYSCEKSDKQITCSKNLTFKTRTIPLTRYPEFRKLCTKIDRAEAQDIVLEKK
jgi:tetratricopeptide (TPR) repeat protein